MTGSTAWLEALARRWEARYEPEADERWIRSWEPFATLRVAERYQHSFSTTGSHGSRTLAQALYGDGRATWVLIAQDDRLQGHAACHADPHGPLRDPHVAMTRQYVGNPSFDQVFATHANSAEDAMRAFGSSVQKLLLSWAMPVHVEVRPGGLILAPVTLPSDPTRLDWLWNTPIVFGEKTVKSRAR